MDFPTDKGMLSPTVNITGNVLSLNVASIMFLWVKPKFESKVDVPVKCPSSVYSVMIFGGQLEASFQEINSALNCLQNSILHEE